MTTERDASAGGRDDEARVRDLLETAGARPELPGEDLEAIVAAARSEWEVRWGGGEGPRGGAASRRRWVAAAAVLAATLVVAVGVAWWWQGARSAGEAPAVVARAERVVGPVQVASGESDLRVIAAGDPMAAGAWIHTGGAGVGPLGRLSLRLASGTTVRVDAGSRLRLVSTGVLDLERGAVYVDTGAAQAGGGGIEVRTPLGTARNVGTQFVVRTVGGAEGSVRVQVRQGAVEVDRGRATYRAGPGDELVIRGEGPVERREVSPHGRHWEWVIEAAPPFELEGRTLEELLDWVSRETGWRVLFEDDALAASAGEIVLHGSLGELRADEAAFTILPGAGLEGELWGGALVVRRGDSR